MSSLVWPKHMPNNAYSNTTPAETSVCSGVSQQIFLVWNKYLFTERFRVGQNIYISMATVETTSSDWPSAVRSWYDEVVDMTNAYVASLP